MKFKMVINYECFKNYVKKINKFTPKIFRYISKQLMYNNLGSKINKWGKTFFKFIKKK